MMTFYYYPYIPPYPRHRPPTPVRPAPSAPSVVQQQGAILQELRKKLDEQSTEIAGLRKSVDHNDATLKELQSAVRQPAPVQKLSELMQANKKSQAQLADHARVINRHAEIINGQAGTIAGIEHHVVTLTAATWALAVVLLVVLGITLFRGRGGTRVSPTAALMADLQTGSVNRK